MWLDRLDYDRTAQDTRIIRWRRHGLVAFGVESFPTSSTDTLLARSTRITSTSLDDTQLTQNYSDTYDDIAS
jgi:hypothetical protein